MRRLVTRRRLAELNAQQWADFRVHWPMELVDLAKDFGAGTLLGVALGLSFVVEVLFKLAAE